MGGDAEKILYVGQSKNLRSRLATYKNARLDRCPRKIIRLVHSVRSIVWEECGTAEAARLKENELLRIHRPKFNVMNTYPQGYRFIGVELSDGKLIFRLVREANAPEKIFGAFKSGCGIAYLSLLRLLWAAWKQPTSPHDFPAPLLSAKLPREYVFREGCGSWMELSKNFLAGESDDLVRALANALPRAETLCAFQRNLQTSDLEILCNFFERGPKRNNALRKEHDIEESIIAQEQLDDLLVIGTGAGGSSAGPGQPPPFISK
jgi:excinuclease UvrABC nuclease subunit